MSAVAADNTRRPGLVGWVLGLPIAALLVVLLVVVPLGFAVLLGKNVYDWLEARSWQPVQATLVHVDLRRQSDSDSGTTWRVEAAYTYDWQGQRYRSDRVDLHIGADNIGDYHQRLYDRLEAARRAGATVTAWVDPDAPARAVLNRDMRWGRFGLLLLFPLFFGGVAVAVFLGSRKKKRQQQLQDQRRQQYPDQPWMWHARWASNIIEEQGRARMWKAIGIAVMWNAVSVPVVFPLLRELTAGNRLALVALLFPTVGVALIVWAVREVLRRRRYGESRLELDTLPVPLGGHLRATLNIPARLEGRKIAVHCACLHRYATGSGKNRRTTELTLWEDRQRIVSRSGGPGRTWLRIDMRLPDDRPVAREDDPDDRIVWQLEVTSEERGIDYRSVFELPVFEQGIEKGEPAVTFGAEDWRETGVVTGYASGGQRFFFPRLRLVGAGLGALLFALIFVGLGAILIAGKGEWLFGGVFGLLGLLVLWGAVTMLFSRSEIIIGGGRLRWRHGVFGRWREIEAAVVKAIDIAHSGSIGRNLYFRIEIERWGHERKTTIADWVPNERAARSFAAHLAKIR